MRRTKRRDGGRGPLKWTAWIAAAILVTACASKPGVHDPREAADSHAGIGLHLLREGRIAPARERLERALALYPEHPQALSGLGLTAELEGFPEAAIGYHRRAVAAAPDDGPLRNNLGRVLCRYGDTAEALEHLAKAAASPGYRRPEVPLTNAAICALDHGDLEAAEGFVDAAMARAPDFPAAWRSRGELLYRRGRSMEGAEALDRYMERAGTPSPRGLYWAALAHGAAGAGEQGDAYRQQLHEYYPNSRYAERLKGQ